MWRSVAQCGATGGPFHSQGDYSRKSTETAIKRVNPGPVNQRASRPCKPDLPEQQTSRAQQRARVGWNARGGGQCSIEHKTTYFAPQLSENHFCSCVDRGGVRSYQRVGLRLWEPSPPRNPLCLPRGRWGRRGEPALGARAGRAGRQGRRREAGAAGQGSGPAKGRGRHRQEAEWWQPFNVVALHPPPLSA